MTVDFVITGKSKSFYASFLILRHSTTLPIMAVLEKEVYYKGYVTSSFGYTLIPYIITAVISSGLPLPVFRSSPVSPRYH